MNFYRKNYGEELWLEHMLYHTALHDCHRVLPSIWELRAAMSSDDQNRLAEYINSPGIEATLEINFNTIKDNNKCTCWLCKRNWSRWIPAPSRYRDDQTSDYDTESDSESDSAMSNAGSDTDHDE